MFLFYLIILKFANNPSLESIILKQNESIPLNALVEHQTTLVIGERSFNRRQEFSVKVKNKIKENICIIF